MQVELSLGVLRFGLLGCLGSLGFRVGFGGQLGIQDSSDMIPLGLASNAATGSKSRLEAQNSRLDCLKKGGHCFHIILSILGLHIGIMGYVGLYRVYVGIMEKKMETTIMGYIGFNPKNFRL